MKIIVGQTNEQGVQIMANDEGNAPLVFEDMEDATSFVVEATKLPPELVAVLFQFYEITDEELQELVERNQ